MKKVFYATLALGALILASCQKENSVELPKVDSPVFTAHIDAGTKTVLNAAGTKSEWVSGDAIRVLNEKGDAANYTTNDNDATATFKTDVKGFTGEQYVALYPASPAGHVTWESSRYIKKLWLKNIQTAVKGSYDSDAHIAYAYTDNSTLNFKNLVSLLKFTIDEGSKEVSSISVSVPTPSGNQGYISGNFTYDSTADAYYNEGGSQYTTATLTGTFVAGQTYYMAVLPGTYSELTLKVNNKVRNHKKDPTTFNASKVYDLGSINVQDEQKEIVMTIDKQNTWDNLYIYAWDSSDIELFGKWPGTKVEGTTVTFPKTYYQNDLNFILSTEIASGITVKTKNKSRKLDNNFSFILPAEPANSIIVSNYPDWAKKIHVWGITGITSEWPGFDLVSHDVYSYIYWQNSILESWSETFGFLINGAASPQTNDLSPDSDNVTKKDGRYYYYYQESDKKKQ